MLRKTSLGLTSAAFGLILSTAFLNCSVLAQSTDRRELRHKGFGSSLKRLRWDPEKKAAVEITPAGDEGDEGDEDVVRVETSLVVSDVLVLDAGGRPVLGLTKDDFLVTEDGVPQQVDSFSLGDNAAVPRSIVLILDYSGSQLPFIQTSVEAARTLVDQLAPQDRMAIVTDDVELLEDFTSDKKKLKKKLELLEKKVMDQHQDYERRFGRSLQYTALMATLREVFQDEDQRPIIIFQTDGDELVNLRNTPVNSCRLSYLPPDIQKRIKREERENKPEFGLDDIYKTAQKSRATIYTVVPGFGQLIGLTTDQQIERLVAFRQKTMQKLTIPRARRLGEEALKSTPIDELRCQADRTYKMQSALAVLSTVTGGWTDFLEDPSQAANIYSHIFSDINRRYVVGYYPTNKERDGRRRKLSIEVKGHPEYTVVGRRTYYAPGAEQTTGGKP